METENNLEVTEFEKMTDYPEKVSSFDACVYEKLLKNIRQASHSILIGPPGTGKTRTILKILNEHISEFGLVEKIQFHPQYTYQDFIEGHVVNDGKFVYKQGTLVDFISRCSVDKLNVLLIDEVNRADIGSVFGELLFMLDSDELDRTVKLPLSGQLISIPKNFVIVGTMNSADKNIAIMDFAIRRRFKFIFVPPDMLGLRGWLSKIGIDDDKINIDIYIKAISTLNQRIASHPLFGKNMTLGQAMFVPKSNAQSGFTIDDIADQFNSLIIPQIEAYLGFANIKDIALILSPEVKIGVEKGIEISVDDVKNLILALSESKEFQGHDE